MQVKLINNHLFLLSFEYGGGVLVSRKISPPVGRHGLGSCLLRKDGRRQGVGEVPVLKTRLRRVFFDEGRRGLTGVFGLG
jgi:hypothetical protein